MDLDTDTHEYHGARPVVEIPFYNPNTDHLLLDNTTNNESDSELAETAYSAQRNASMADGAKKRLSRSSAKGKLNDENLNPATMDGSRASISSASRSLENSRYSTPLTSVPTTPMALDDKDAQASTRRTSKRLNRPSTLSARPRTRTMSQRLSFEGVDEEDDDESDMISQSARRSTRGSLKRPSSIGRSKPRKPKERYSFTDDNEQDDDESDIIPQIPSRRTSRTSFSPSQIRKMQEDSRNIALMDDNEEDDEESDISPQPTRRTTRTSFSPSQIRKMQENSRNFAMMDDNLEDEDESDSPDAQLARQLQAEEDAKLIKPHRQSPAPAQASTSTSFRRSPRQNKNRKSYTQSFSLSDSGDDDMFALAPAAKKSRLASGKGKVTKTEIPDTDADEPFTSDLPAQKKFKQPPKAGKLFGSEIPDSYASQELSDLSDAETLVKKKLDKGKGKAIEVRDEEDLSDDEPLAKKKRVDKGKGKQVSRWDEDSSDFGDLSPLSDFNSEDDFAIPLVPKAQKGNGTGGGQSSVKKKSKKVRHRPKVPEQESGESSAKFNRRMDVWRVKMDSYQENMMNRAIRQHRGKDTETSDTDFSLESDNNDANLSDVSESYIERSRRLRNMTPQDRFAAMAERRARKARKRLEDNHPSLLTMWTDLEDAPKIPPTKAEQPKHITRQLKPFQLEGLHWMMEMEKTKWGGGLLGDEMGMGKTIQAVSLIMSDYPQPKPSLVLIPPVAMMQWQEEIAQYTNGVLKTFVYHGTNAASKNMTVRDIKKYDVVLMSYNSLESIYRFQEKGRKRKNAITGDMDTIYQKSPIHAIDWHRIILDEAHNIKSRTTGAARACFALTGSHKWCLSGTPLQNRIGEFFSLIRFLNVQPFGSYYCRSCPCTSLEWKMGDNNRCTECNHGGMQHVSVFNQELLNPIQKHGNSGPGAEAFRKLRLLTDRFMLRRVKTEHSSAMELPAKEIYVDRHFFGEEENDFAASIMGQSTRKFETYVAQGVLLNNYANIFGLIMQMRQVADHPDLILKKDGAGGMNVVVCCICDEAAEDAVRSACKHEFCRSCVKSYLTSCEKTGSDAECPRCHLGLSIDLEQPELVQDSSEVKKNSIINRINMAQWTSSSKIEALLYELHLLRSKNSSCKSIIFSSFTTMLQLIEWRLRRAGITTVMLDGSMTPAQRQASISAFMTDPSIECFLVSLKAGGVALNLTEASRVFLVDPWWNPAAEWQSADRCHRIGQCRPCTITRLCIEDSVESRMVLLQEKKTNMIKSTVEGSKEAMESLTPEDMQFLFRGS